MQSFDLNNRTDKTYGLDTASLNLPTNATNMMSCVLAPAEQSHGHNHAEYELFWFTSGPAKVTNGTETVDLPQGHAVLFEPFESHIIENPDPEKPLEFLSLYWFGSLTGLKDAQAAETQRDALVFSTPPTPNGDLHLGHLSGPYLAGDVLSRSLRQSGHKTWYGSGRDDHQTYVPVQAEKQGLSPEETAQSFAQMIQTTWRNAGISMDGFTVPDRDGAYADFVRQGIARLKERGFIIEKDAPAAFDASGTYLHEAHIQGICPHCHEGSDGNACEACGQPNDCVDLIDARVRSSNAVPAIRTEKRLYFRLSAFEDALAQYVRMAQMPAKVVDLCAQMLEDGLPDICISHPGDWGISHDIPGHEHAIVYVWFEMAFGYLWQAAEIVNGPGDRWKRATKVYDGSTDIAHCYGFDNAYYHALLFPAVYLGLDMGLTPPRYHVVNELLDLDGSKFSTSRGHLIWARDVLGTVPTDYVRFALSYDRPEGVRSNFLPDNAIDLLNSTFAEDLNFWVNTLAQAVGTGKTLPDIGSWTAEQQSFMASVTRLTEQIDASLSLNGFSSRDAARHIRALIAAGARFADTQASFLTSDNPRNANYRRTAVALLAHGLRCLARAAAPVLSETANGLGEFLGLAANDTPNTILPAGHRIFPNRAPKLEPIEAFQTTNPSPKKTVQKVAI